jgi:hypothetical protein
MKVSIDYKGRVKGMDKVLTAAMEEFVGLDYEKTDEACIEFGRLAREIAELAWICRISAGKRHYFGYEFEVFVTATGLRWQRYRTAAAPPLPLPHSPLAG